MTCRRDLIVNSLTFKVQTEDNFSLMTAKWDNTDLGLGLGLNLLGMIFREFEKRFDLKVISWQIIEYSSGRFTEILVNHVPKEKARAVRAPETPRTLEDEPDIGL